MFQFSALTTVIKYFPLQVFQNECLPPMYACCLVGTFFQTKKRHLERLVDEFVMVSLQYDITCMCAGSI